MSGASESRSGTCSRFAEETSTMRFRSKIFAVLTVVGLLPLALLGFLSFSVNRAELELSSSAAQEALAQEAGAVRGSVRPPRVVAAQCSRRELQQDMREIARAPAIAFLEAADGGLLASAAPAEAPRAFAELASAAAFSHGPFSRVVAGPDGARWLASAAPVGGLGWTAVLAQPAAAALGPALRV